MSWYRGALSGLSFIAIGLGIVSSAPMAGQERPKSSSVSKPVAHVGGVDFSSDPLDDALERAGMRRSALGFYPRGWWTRYPRAALHKLDHVDDIFQEPLAVVPFTRTLAQAVREFLGPEGLAKSDSQGELRRSNWGPLGSHSLFRLVSTAVGRRYGGQALLYSASLRPEETPLDKAILALYRYVGEPTRSFTAGVEPPHPSNLEAEINRRTARLSPEVDRILGRLVLDVVDAHRHAALAFRNVTREQRLEISQRVDMWNALGVFGGLEYVHVHVFDDVAKAWDEASLWYAALKCVEALDRARRALEALPREKLTSASFDWETPLGWIRVRGTGPDNIDATDALLIVDLGGDDVWRGPVGASSATRLLGLALDLSGDDVYDGATATQGAGIAGVGILLDAKGNDRYQAERYSQGIGQFGLGALIDLGGNDVYRAGHSAQGSAAFGIGLLADAAGDDRYEILANGQGFGGPGGVGILADRAGNDVYRAEPDAQKSGHPYPGSKFSASTAQGVGVGRIAGYAGLHSWAGGLGALVDIEGDDSYIAGTWSQGSGINFGAGLLYDGAGNDRYEGGDLWTQASAAHFAMGVLLDEGGDDIHLVHGNLGLASAHDMSIALLVAIGGNDLYTIAGSGLGYSRDRSLAIFVDVGGDDAYRGRDGNRPGFALYDPRFIAEYDGMGTINDSLGMVNPYMAYVSSLGLFLDVGGRDSYWGGLSDGGVWGDEPGSDNWKARNVGVGMDVPVGTIDWRPLPVAEAPRPSRRDREGRR